MKTIERAQLHRFGDLVAIYLQDGETVYLNPTQAEMIIEAMQNCVDDIHKCKFTKSDFKTVEFNFGE